MQLGIPHMHTSTSVLNIFYIHYDVKNKLISKNRPNWFSYTSCLNNIIHTLSFCPLDVKINFCMIFDGDIISFKRNVPHSVFDLDKVIQRRNCDYSAHLVNAGSAAQAARSTLLYVCKQELKDDSLVYILENDYLHIDRWVEHVRDINQSRIKFDYLSLYDHADKYQHEAGFDKRYLSLKSKIFASKQLHWRTTRSTCFSFLCRAKTIKQDAHVFLRFPDHQAFTILRFLKRRVLLSAVPGLSTHCMTDLLSPTIDWEEISRRHN